MNSKIRNWKKEIQTNILYFKDNPKKTRKKTEKLTIENNELQNKQNDKKKIHK